MKLETIELVRYHAKGEIHAESFWPLMLYCKPRKSSPWPSLFLVSLRALTGWPWRTIVLPLYVLLLSLCVVLAQPHLTPCYYSPMKLYGRTSAICYLIFFVRWWKHFRGPVCNNLAHAQMVMQDSFHSASRRLRFYHLKKKKCFWGAPASVQPRSLFLRSL